jgi:preprotein translocase subunit SecG
METVLRLIQLIACVALIVVILFQRSEGGALGIGGGGGGGGLVSGRGTASLLTRATMILGAVFFCASLATAVLASADERAATAAERAAEAIAPSIDLDIPDDLGPAAPPLDPDAVSADQSGENAPAGEAQSDESVEGVNPTEAAQPASPQ